MLNKFIPFKPWGLILLFLLFGNDTSIVNAQSNNPEILLAKVLPLLEFRFNIRFGYDPEIIKTFSLNKKILAT